jgi:hypothetical protein
MAITTPTEVRFAGQITAEYTDDEILSEIDIVEAELYQKYHLPSRSQITIDPLYTEFFIYPNEIHEIVRAQVQVETTVNPSGYELVAEGSDTWSFGSPNNYVTLSGSFIALYPNKLMRYEHIPKIFNMIATNQAALNLIDSTSIVDGSTIDTPRAVKLKDKITRYKELLKPIGITRSSPYIDYDEYEYIAYNQLDLR